MESGQILADIKNRLEKLTIHELRQVARAVGVHRPADGKKSRVTDDIIEIASGRLAPEPPSLRGAPPKSQAFDEELVSAIKSCRELFLNGSDSATELNVTGVADSGYTSLLEADCNGILDKTDKLYFLRVNGCIKTVGEDVFVHDSFVARFNLRVGDRVCGKCKRRSFNEAPGLVSVTSVNGKESTFASRREFKNLTRVFPDKRIEIARGGEDVALRMIDMFSPVALGQRALITAPANSGKTTLIKAIASAICCKYRDLSVIVLLIGERPEEITEYARSIDNAELFYTAFDSAKSNHVQTANLVFENAKRKVEHGENVVVIMDGISRLRRAYPIDCDGSEEVKKLLYNAANFEEGGSLTVISTVSVTDGEEFSDIANMTVTLSQKLALQRVFPAIDITASFTGGEDRLLSADEIGAAARLRAEVYNGTKPEDIIKLFKETADNGEIIQKFKD